MYMDSCYPLNHLCRDPCVHFKISKITTVLPSILLLLLDFPYNPLSLPSHMALDFPKPIRHFEDSFADNDSDSSRSKFEALREPHCVGQEERKRVC